VIDIDDGQPMIAAVAGAPLDGCFASRLSRVDKGRQRTVEGLAVRQSGECILLTVFQQRSKVAV